MKRFVALWFCMMVALYSCSSIAGAMDSLIKGSAEKLITQQQIDQLTSRPATTQPVSVKQVSTKKLSAKKETTPTSDFIDNNNGTVTHRTTGLTWQRCAVGQKWTGSRCSGSAKGYSYQQALTLTSNFAGHNDWRLPTIEELRGIVERENTAPAINTTIFPDTHTLPKNNSASFRSSSLDPEDRGYAAVVNFYDGSDDFSEDDGDGCGSCVSVRLVRSGQSFAASANPANTLVTDYQLASAKVGNYSSSAVWESKVGTVFLDCITSDHTKELNCILAKMKQSGASQEAMRFVKQFTAPEESIGWLSEFKEKGRVDLGFVQFANRANTNEAYFLLNGNPSMVSTELGCTVGGAWHQPCQNMEVDISHDPIYPRLKKQYPKLELWPAGASFISMRSNADGGQRFIFGYPLLNGCHACEVAGGAEVAFDFSGDGTFKGTKLLRLVGVEAEKTVKAENPVNTQVADSQSPSAKKEVIVDNNKALGTKSFPVIFIHGVTSSAETWTPFTDYLINKGGWIFGGVLIYNKNTKEVSISCAIPIELGGCTRSYGDFYTVEYPDNQYFSFDVQGAELSAIIQRVLKENPDKRKVVLVAHSMGGLAAREYIQGLAREFNTTPWIKYRDDVDKLITIGTPHQGSALPFICTDTTMPIYTEVIFDYYLCKKELKLNPYASALTELKINSTALQVLNNLSSHPLPESVSYVSLIGTGVTNPFVFNEDGDGVVTAISQNLGALVPPPNHHETRNIYISDCGHKIGNFGETHTCEAGDPDVWTAILSALHKTSVTPQGKIDVVGNKSTPVAKPKVKKVTRTECNKSSSVTSTSTGSAQEALKKFGTGTDGCSQ